MVVPVSVVVSPEDELEPNVVSPSDEDPSGPEVALVPWAVDVASVEPETVPGGSSVGSGAVLVLDVLTGSTVSPEVLEVELPDEPAAQSSSEPLRRLLHDGERVWLTGQLGRLFTLERP